MKLAKVLLLAAVAALVFTDTATAGTITCPTSPAAGDRVFSLTTTVDATCFSQGSGNMADNQPGAPWVFLDKDQSPDFPGLQETWLTLTGMGATSGTFNIAPAAWAAYGQILLGFKTGCGSQCADAPNPDWVIFRLAPNTLSGSWSVYEFPNLQTQGLSHSSLWASGTPDSGCTTNCTVTPEPATLLLFGTGLAGLAVRLRRRKA